MTRWYHSFNTRYNVYFNGKEAFDQALKSQQEGYQEEYTDQILMYPVSSLPKDKKTPGGPFDKSYEKAVKAIKSHSIKEKPEKKAGKRNDPKYQEFMSREEYNPFLHKAWMLMGESQFYNGDFLQASSTFSYIARHYVSQPEIVAPAKIWQARCYSEMGWNYDADNLLSQINNEHLPTKQNAWFSAVYADYLVKNKRYQDAVPYLNVAIDNEKNKLQKARMRYLLGQIYTTLDNKTMAYKTFEEVAKSNTTYKLEFSAKIRQTEVFPGGNTQKLIGMLNSMSKSSKNKDYLDQVYYAMGNVYMTIPDTAKAIASYAQGVTKSTQNGLDKALCQVVLGDLYFQQRNYIQAQPCYADAMGILKKEHKDYARVAKRSEVLDELVVFYEAIHLQDSLQALAKLPEADRMVVINNIIENLKKKEEEEKEKAQREEYLAKQEDVRNEMMNRRGNPGGALPGPMPGGPQSNEFYFYNATAIAQGKNIFQQRWGRRKLEDDWRRRNKISPIIDEFADSVDAANDMQAENISETNAVTDSIGHVPAEEDVSSDPKDPKFYLQQIPFTPEDVEASNLIIMDGLFNMGVIYKDNLEDFSLSIETFNTLDTRFPDNEFKLDSYYHLYLIYLKLRDSYMAELYKAKIRSEFPESELAIAMADPHYEYNMSVMHIVQDSIYQDTYKAYMEGNTSLVRQNYKLASERYAQSPLIPKFMFLNALSYVQTHQPNDFKIRLKELIERFPNADVTALAGEMMKGLQRGLTLSGNGNLIQGQLFNIRFGVDGNEDFVPDSMLVFSPEKNAPHEMLLLYPTGSVNDNMLLFTVAEYNFSNFMVNDFDLVFETFGDISMLQIRGFFNQDEIMQYYRMINQDTGYAHQLDSAVVIVPISIDNFNILLKGKSLDEYIQFFTKQYGGDNAHLINQWNKQQKTEIKKLEKEIESDDSSEDEILPDTTKNISIETEKTDSLQSEFELIIPTDSIQKVPLINQAHEAIDKVNEAADDVNDGLDDVNEAAGKAVDVINSANETLNKISEDPIRGIRDLFSKRKKSNAIDEYVKQQEKEEKERQKQLDKEKKEKEKAEKEQKAQEEKERKALLKQQEEEEKAILKAKEQQEKNLRELKKQELKEKEAAKKQLQKEKEAARKQKEADAKARQKQKEKERKEKEKAAEEARKQKEKEREAARKQKEAERKAKQK